MEMSPQINELGAALAKAQGAFKPIERNREVTVTLKDNKGKYSFWYATMDTIVDSVRQPLAENGLSFSQGIDGSSNGTVVETILLHSSGQWLKSTIPVYTEAKSSQALGSGITYAKRYALTALLGLVTEEDDDGNDGDGNRVVVKHDKPAYRSENDPNWKGPLNLSTLKTKLREAHSELSSCTDSAQFVALLISLEPILVQCVADLPEWWSGNRAKGVEGVKQAILTWGAKLETDIRHIISEIESD